MLPSLCALRAQFFGLGPAFGIAIVHPSGLWPMPLWLARAACTLPWGSLQQNPLAGQVAGQRSTAPAWASATGIVWKAHHPRQRMLATRSDLQNDHGQRRHTERTAPTLAKSTACPCEYIPCTSVEVGFQYAGIQGLGLHASLAGPGAGELGVGPFHG